MQAGVLWHYTTGLPKPTISNRRRVSNVGQSSVVRHSSAEVWITAAVPGDRGSFDERCARLLPITKMLLYYVERLSYSRL